MSKLPNKKAANGLFAHREIFVSDRAKYVSIKLEPRDLARLDRLAVRERAQRASAARLALRKGFAALRA